MPERQSPDQSSLRTRISKFLERIGIKESPERIKRRLTHLATIPKSEVPAYLLESKPPRVKIRLHKPEPARELQAVSPERTIRASEIFLRSIRDPARIVRRERCTLNAGIVDFIDDRGLRVDAPLERGFFHTTDVLVATETRYYLPMAMYIIGAHARLLLRGPYTAPSGQREIQVYDPMIDGITSLTLTHPPDLDPTVIHANYLAQSAVRTGKYDLSSLLEDPRLREYREALLNAKLPILQKAGDYSNCVPLCLLANALFYGFQPGDTVFKSMGISQFTKDFSIIHAGMPMSVRILKREEILPPDKSAPRVRVR